MVQVLRGATVIDGTGAPRRSADVVVSDGMIVSCGDVRVPTDAEVVDLAGLVLAPGFIDIHTHLDCQVLWDPDLTPSSWHGVTTVVLGNCGFSIAPTRPEHRETMMRTLENVEAMPFDALQSGITWDFQTFPEYLQLLQKRPKRLNVGALIGHTAVRLSVMGADSTERKASDEEIGEMRTIVREAMEAGALGFASSQAQGHLGAFGKPVPSRLADAGEITELSFALTDVGRGVIQVVCGPDFGPRECATLSASTGRPLTFIGGGSKAPGARLELLDELDQWGGNIVLQTACRAITVQLCLTDLMPLFSVSEAFREGVSLSREDLRHLYTSESWRERVKSTLKDRVADRLARATLEETDRHTALIGMTLGEIARQHGTEPIDALIDLSLADDLLTRFRLSVANDDAQELALLLADKRSLVGLSDAGAHLSQLCDADYATYLLSHWVRDQKALNLEDAIWRLTSQPAEVFGIPHRGKIAPGYHADLVAFDPEQVGTTPPRRVRDLPGGADRLVALSTGITHIWVNGAPIRWDGTDVDNAAPGTLVSPPSLTLNNG